MSPSERTLQRLLEFQRDEITEHEIYLRLAEREDGENARILRRIADDEKKHYSVLREHTGRDVSPDRLKVAFYTLVARIFGFTFAIKLMEMGEESAQAHYREVAEEIPELASLIREEEEHEDLLISMLREERVEYVGSMILGLNDAIVELTGAISGLSQTIASSIFVGIAGLIMGIAASMSMAASEFLSRKSEGSGDPKKGAIYTGLAYIVAVLIMTAPFFVIGDKILALASMFMLVVVMILLFSFYVSVVKDRRFRDLVIEMLAIVAGVSAASMLIGWLARTLLGIEI